LTLQGVLLSIEVKSMEPHSCTAGS